MNEGGGRLRLTRRGLLAGLGATVLWACQSPPPRQRFPELTWTHLSPLKLDVAEVEIASQYEATFKPPHVEHLVPVPPEEAAWRWAEDRLRAAGAQGKARAIIRDARIVEAALATREDLRGYLTTEQAERYDAAVEMEVEIRDSRGTRVGYAIARAERSRTVPEDLTLNERERVWFKLTEALMTDFDGEMSKNIRAHLARFVV